LRKQEHRVLCTRPLKTTYKKEITKLNRLLKDKCLKPKNSNLSSEELDYIKRCHKMYVRCNSLSLNFDKTYFLQFRPKNSYEIDIKIICDKKLIRETKKTKFLGLDIYSSLSWKNHIDQMMFKLSTACYAIRYVKNFMSQDTLRTIYFSYFHSIL